MLKKYTKSQTSSALFNPSETRLEHWLRIYINNPLTDLIPPSVHPNTISYINALNCWVLLAFAYLANLTEPSYPFLTLIIRIKCAFFIFASMILDCLDGLHARKTDQCSTLGELLDHTLDAAN